MGRVNPALVECGAGATNLLAARLAHPRFHGEEAPMRLRWQWVAVAVAFVGWDAATWHEREVAELRGEVERLVEAGESAEREYREVLAGVVKRLYQREVYGTGGDVRAPGKVGMRVLYEAVVNAADDYQALGARVDNYFDGRREFLRDVPSIWPVLFDSSVRITSAFGGRYSPFSGQVTTHTGIDVVSKDIGSPILATADGVVRDVWIYHKVYGKMIVIDHAGGFSTMYAHMDWTIVGEKVRVRQGDRIGWMGSTGESQGRHLHYEVHKDGVPVNPVDFLRSVVVR